MQKEKVDINNEKSTCISIIAKEIVRQRWPQPLIMKSKQAKQ